MLGEGGIVPSTVLWTREDTGRLDLWKSPGYRLVIALFTAGSSPSLFTAWSSPSLFIAWSSPG